MTAGGALVAEYDVVVIGGGCAGCATALALARQGAARVLIVEAGNYAAVRIGETIPPDTRRVLHDLGVLLDFIAEAHEPSLGSCSSWGSDELGYNDFLFNPLGHGWHLERARFDAFLARKAAESGAELRTGTRIAQVEGQGGGFRLRLTDDDGRNAIAETRFVVDATGMRSSFARRLGAKRLFVDQLLCVMGYFELPDAGFSRLTILEAVPYGWWYAAKLPNRRVAVAVASDAAIVKQAALHRRDGWLSHLAQTQHVSVALAGALPIGGSLLTCAAPSFRLDAAAGENWIAVGDAACAFDPISSQGIYKALNDGTEAARAIADCLAGKRETLDAYRAAVTERFEAYLENRNYFYRLEGRWPASAFWSRRRARTTYGRAELQDA